MPRGRRPLTPEERAQRDADRKNVTVNTAGADAAREIAIIYSRRLGFDVSITQALQMAFRKLHQMNARGEDVIAIADPT